jgi:hypothetical protein
MVHIQTVETTVSVAFLSFKVLTNRNVGEEGDV